MIDFEYKLITDLGAKKEIYTPDKIKPPLDNLTYIEGPNGSGKSTLLNIIALGFYGLKTPDLHEDLRDNLIDLMDTKQNELSFKLKLTNNDGSIELIAEKPDFRGEDIYVKEIIDGKKPVTLDQKRFANKYQLIYDIPVKPKKRLDNLTRVIRDRQNRYSARLGSLFSYIFDLIIKIDNAKNPDRIKELEKELNVKKKELDSLINSEEIFKKDLDVLEKYAYARLYEEYDKYLESKNKELSKLKNKVTKSHKKIMKINNKVKAILIQLRADINQLIKVYNDTTFLLEQVLQKKYDLSTWKSFNFNDVLDNFSFDVIFDIELSEVKNYIYDLLEKEENKKATIVGDLFNQLILDLKDHIDLDIVLPGGKKIREFIEDLEKNQEEFKQNRIYLNNLRTIRSKIDEIQDKIAQIRNDPLPELRKLKKEKPDLSLTNSGDPELLEEHIKTLESEIQKLKNKKNFYQGYWQIKGSQTLSDIRSIKSEWLEYTQLDEDDLLAAIKSKQTQIEKIKIKKSKFNDNIKSLTKEIEDINKKEEHPYQKYRDFFNDELLEITRDLNFLISNKYNGYINDLLNRKAKHSKDEEKERYYNSIFTYLAKKLKKLRHVDKEYDLKSVDLIDRVFISTKNDIIPFSRISTGQSQTTYLQTKLNLADDRVIIAMFDEVAMMDITSLKPIYSKFNELYNNGNLLAGIVVQKNDKTTNVQPISEKLS